MLMDVRAKLKKPCLNGEDHFDRAFRHPSHLRNRNTHEKKNIYLCRNDSPLETDI